MPETSSQSSSRLTVAVVGLGGIGSAAAAALTHAGRHAVVACARRPIDHMTLERPEGTVSVRLRTLTDPAAAEPVDWVLMCTKAHHTASCAPWLARLCTPRTRVAVLQNGIDHAGRLAPFTGGATVVPTVVYYNGERLGDDRVRLRHVTEHELAAPDDAGGRAFADLVADAHLRVLTSPDFDTLIWRKLLVNIVVNPITTLTLERQGVLRRDDVRALILGLLDEAVAVARADGARLADDEAARIREMMMSFPVDAGTSMYFDRLAGRPLEVDALTGALVAVGERHGIATPLNRTLLTLLRAVSDANAARAQ
jgi:2-dehydropantoate 2-reductase